MSVDSVFDSDLAAVDDVTKPIRGFVASDEDV
jgi:hypothetical protein